MKTNKKELIKNVNTMADWIYQRVEFDYNILVRIFNQLLEYLSQISNQGGEKYNNNLLVRYRDRFSEMTTAFEAQDLILVADILHHEFAENLLSDSPSEVVRIEQIPVSEELWIKNNEAFIERYENSIPDVPDKLDLFSIGYAEDGSRIIYIKNNDNHIRMNSSYDPSYEAMRWAEKYKKIENVQTTIVMQGILNGFFLRALKLKSRANVSFIVYEPSLEFFSFVCKNFNLVDIIEDSRVRLVLPTTGEDGLYKVISDATDPINVNVFGVITPGYNEDETFLNICKQLRDIDEASDGFRTGLAKEAMQNRLYAFSKLHKNFLVSDFLKVIPKDLPIFMVAGGPSLLKNVEYMKGVKGRGLIVAIERAVSVLLKNGIQPDMMVTVDPTKDPSYMDFEEVKDTLLLCGFEANRMAMKPHNEHLIFMHSDVRWNVIPGLDGRLLNFGDIGGGVAPAAFIHFLYNHTKNLVLVGQDLSIEGPMTHADGHNDIVIEKNLFEVDGLLGGKVKTRWDLDRFRHFMERKMKEYPDTTVTDATEGGVLIHGTKVKSLRETVDDLCVTEWNIPNILAKIPHAQTEEQHDETITYMCMRLKELRDIKARCPELVNLCHQLVNACKYGDIGSKSNGRRIDRFNTLRNQNYRTVVNDWLEETWVTDRRSVPNAFIVVRTNEESYPVFKSAYEYYTKLPDYINSLGWVIKHTFEFSEEDYEKRIKLAIE